MHHSSVGSDDKTSDEVIFMFAPCIKSFKALFIIPTDAHNYKITGMLKQCAVVLVVNDEHNRTTVVVLAKYEVAP